MTTPKAETTTARVLAGLRHDDSSVRLRAALAAGADPDPEFVEPLVERCGVEPVFHVRDMLTWALTRHPEAETVPRVLAELRSPHARARSQALHTLSKIRDRGVWPAITRSLLTDPDDEVARTAWRTAVLLAPEAEAAELAEVLVSQLGRGGRETRLSLSRALIGLGSRRYRRSGRPRITRTPGTGARARHGAAAARPRGGVRGRGGGGEARGVAGSGRASR